MANQSVAIGVSAGSGNCDQTQSESTRLLERLAAGEKHILGELLTLHQKRLVFMVALRLDFRLQIRIDPSDVVQEAFLHASLRLAEYLRNPAIPFYLWLRLITRQRLLILHRFHLRTERRDAGREVPLEKGALANANSAALAAKFLSHEPRPSEVAMAAEKSLRLQGALKGMDPLDREILALRHFEQMSNAEAAQVLCLRESAASKRYVRALQRLKEILGDMPGGLEEFTP